MRKFVAHPRNIWPPKFLIFPCGAHFVEKKKNINEPEVLFQTL